MTGVFTDWQPAYAEHGIATFPVEIYRDEDGKAAKKPAVKNYARFGLAGSRAIANRFARARALGFVAGKRSRITALDIDSSDERVLADSLDKYGRTRIVTRSGGSGHFQAWYWHNGEKRAVRQLGDQPLDVLGAGVVVAPPSQGLVRSYEFIEGGLDDLDRLPTLTNLPPHIYGPKEAPDGVTGVLASRRAVLDGERGDALWRECMKAAKHCDDFEALLDFATTRNAEYLPPMTDARVLSAAESAWGYTQRDENRFGQHGVYMPIELVDALLARNPDAVGLLSLLKSHQGPNAEFMIANGLAEARIPFGRRRLQAARKTLLEMGEVERIRAARQGVPALYRWPRREGK